MQSMTTEQNRTHSNSSLGNTTPFYSTKELRAKLTRMPINADINKQLDLERFSLRRTNLNGDFLRFRQTKVHPRLAFSTVPTRWLEADSTPNKFLLVGHWIPERADAPHAHFDHISGYDRADPFRRPCGNQVSGHERHEFGGVTNNDIKRKDEIASVAVLPDFPVHASLNRHTLPRIDFVGDQRPDRTKCVIALPSRPLRVFFLQIAGREIVDHRITKNIRTDILIGRKLVTPLAYHDSSSPS